MVHPRLKLVSKSRPRSQSRATSISRSASSSPTPDDKDDTSSTSASKQVREEMRLPSFAALDKSLDHASPPPHPLIRLNLLEEGRVEWDESSRLRLRYDPERDNAGAMYVIPPLRTSTMVPALDPRVGGQEEMSNGGEDSGAAIMSEAREQGDINGAGAEAPAVERVQGVKSSREPEDGPQGFTTPSTSTSSSSTVDTPLQQGLRLIAGCIDLYISEAPPSLSKSLRQFTAGNSRIPEPSSKPIAVPVLPSSALGSRSTPEKARARANKPKNGKEKENGVGKEKEKGKGKGKKKETENKGKDEKENDPDHVKVPRPPNAFFLFRMDLGAKIAKSPLSKGLNQRQILPAIGACWHQLPEHERAHWDQKAKEVAVEHAIKYPRYKFKRGPAKKEDGKSQKSKKGGGSGSRPLDLEKERAIRIARLVMRGIEGEEGLERIDAEAAEAGDDGETPDLEDSFPE